jgi:6-pyruvoyltetrahydropterin/6-carboxytetrahydropterin synthase
MYTICKQFQFEAGHRIQQHKGKCVRPHGHSYQVDVHIDAESLNSMGMVVDFQDIKDTIGRWIDANLDHKFILQKSDPMVHSFMASDVYLMDEPPTAENLARLIANIADILMNQMGLLTGNMRRVDSVTVWETGNSYATYQRGI